MTTTLAVDTIVRAWLADVIFTSPTGQDEVPSAVYDQPYIGTRDQARDHLTTLATAAYDDTPSVYVTAETPTRVTLRVVGYLAGEPVTEDYRLYSITVD